MKIVVSIIVVLLVVSCVSVGASNEYWGTDNVPISFRELLDIMIDFSSYGDVFKGTLAEFEQILEKIGENDVYEWNDIGESKGFLDFLDKIFMGTVSGRATVVIWNLIKLVISTVIDGLILVVDVLHIVFKIIFGVPRPVT